MALENSNLKDWNCTKRISGQIRLKMKRLFCARGIGDEKSDSSKKVTQEIAKKLKNCEESVAEETDRARKFQTLMRCLCNERGLRL